MTTTHLKIQTPRDKAEAFVDKTYDQANLVNRPLMIDRAEQRLVDLRHRQGHEAEVSRSLPLLCPMVNESGFCTKTGETCPAMSIAVESFDYEDCDTYMLEAIRKAKRKIARQVDKRFGRLVTEARLDGSRLVLRFDEARGCMDLVSDVRGLIRSFQVGSDSAKLVKQLSDCLATLDPKHLTDPLTENAQDTDAFLEAGDLKTPDVQFVSATKRYACLRVDGVDFLYETRKVDPYTLAEQFHEARAKSPTTALQTLLQALLPVEDSLERTVALAETTRNCRHQGNFVSPRAAANYLTKLALKSQGEVQLNVVYDLDEGQFMVQVWASREDYIIPVYGLGMTRAHEGSAYFARVLTELGMQGAEEVYRTPQARKGSVLFGRDQAPVWREA